MADTSSATVAGRYRVLGNLGKGAMGLVFMAYDPVLDRKVAIKQMTAEIADNEELRQRFYVEARAAARLNHPNIITIHELQESGGDIFMIMEMLEGKSLAALIQAKPVPLSIEATLDVVAQVCDGLDYAHQRTIIHRDIKPANLFLTPSGTAKILDFGIARLGSLHMTAAGAIIGTPDYMSPEQIRGDEIDRRTDLWAVGAVLYQLLSGVKPFEGKPLARLLSAIAQTPHVPLVQRAPSVPRSVSDLVDRLLSKPRDGRPSSAGIVRDELRAILGRESASSTKATLAEDDYEETVYMSVPAPPRPAAPPETARPDTTRPPSVPPATSSGYASDENAMQTVAGLPAVAAPASVARVQAPVAPPPPPPVVPAPAAVPPAPPDAPRAASAPPPPPPPPASGVRPPPVPAVPTSGQKAAAAPPAALAAPAAKKGSPLVLAAVAVLLLAVAAVGAGAWWYFGSRDASTAEGRTPPAGESRPSTTPVSSPPAAAASAPVSSAPPLSAPPPVAPANAARPADAPAQAPSATPPSSRAAMPSEPAAEPPAPAVQRPPAPVAGRRADGRLESGVDAEQGSRRGGVSHDTIETFRRQGGSGAVPDTPQGVANQAAVSRINDVLGQYVQALVNSDGEALRDYRPNVSSEEATLLRARQLKVRLEDVRVEVNGTDAVARCRRRVDGTGPTGAKIQEDGQATFFLRRRPSGWIITDVR